MSKVEFSFEKLIAWQKARVFYHEIRAITQNFPPAERYDLVSQMNRASHSIVSNIAEGSGRMTPKDKAKFLNISYSSLLEVSSDIILAKDRNYITEEQENKLKEDSLELQRIISGLRNSLQL